MKLCCLSVISMKTTLQAFTFIFFQHRYRRIDAGDFSMFSLATMLPISDVGIVRTLLIIYPVKSCLSAYVCVCVNHGVTNHNRCM